MFVSFLLTSFLISTFLTVAHCKKFIFRQDDVEDNYNTDIQVNLLNFFLDRGISVSAGIIGDHFTGADTKIYSAMQKCVSMAAYKCALHNKGADATFVFSNATSVADAKSRIKSCDDRIKSLFPGYQAEVFVPNKNLWNQYTLQALQELGYPIISAAVAPYSNLPYSTTTNPMQLSQQATTAELDSSGTIWHPLSIQQTVNACLQADARGEVCVIEIHPHEFAQGVYNFTTLENLVTALGVAGFNESVNFHTVLKEVKGLTDSPTLAPTFTPVPTINPTQSPSFRPSEVPSASPTTPVPSAAPTNQPAAGTVQQAYDSSVSFLSNPPSWGYAVIVVAGLLVIAAFVSAVRCCYRANDAKGPAGVRKNEKDLEAADSIEMAQVVSDEKYVPVSARRSFRKDEEIGTIAIPIASNIRVLHDDETKHPDNEDTRSTSHKSIATNSTRSTAEKSTGSRSTNPSSPRSGSSIGTHRSIGTQSLTERVVRDV